jgi:hypothetical protein
VRLRLLPEILVVLALDDFPTDAIDSLHGCGSLHDAILCARTNEPALVPTMKRSTFFLDS